MGGRKGIRTYLDVESAECYIRPCEVALSLPALAEPLLCTITVKQPDTSPLYLKWREMTYDRNTSWAILRNGWPYSLPRDVRHFCVWVRKPILDPRLVDNDPAKWKRIEEQGLGGFTGIIPRSDRYRIEDGIKDNVGRHPHNEREWQYLDRIQGHSEMKRWYGVEHEAEGGHEIGAMVRSLWDERGWECVWFVNPRALQSMPGLSHFHVMARRKSPEEIDASEEIWG
ncbi:hypothetical protein I350_00003 [Cryptococcus amylolentus CBS 6273]|uniref:Uncharacterized protein n=1 Tax=Cryptococcus amylolentus CBS 6273 TaxID=1296118 RepID=A0A1E3KDP7_9TREE|nr:hypothetical protein I350_00003 [Cryptococcus amylolentus CBS 6273]